MRLDIYARPYELESGARSFWLCETQKSKAYDRVARARRLPDPGEGLRCSTECVASVSKTRMLAPLLTDLERKRVNRRGGGYRTMGALLVSGVARSRDRGGCPAPRCWVKLSQPAVVADVNPLPLKDGCADVTICAFAIGYTGSDHRGLSCGFMPDHSPPGGVMFVSDVHPDAIRRGWTRTFRTRAFRSGGELVEIAHHPYALEDLNVPGLELSLLLEPSLGSPEARNLS